MPQYEVEVCEVQHHVKRYIILADSVEEARELAENGETESEKDIRFRGVIDRAILSDPILSQPQPK